jgi:hypothetical protein
MAPAGQTNLHQNLGELWFSQKSSRKKGSRNQRVLKRAGSAWANTVCRAVRFKASGNRSRNCRGKYSSQGKAARI